jgi:hypothetical protein
MAWYMSSMWPPKSCASLFDDKPWHRRRSLGIRTMSCSTQDMKQVLPRSGKATTSRKEVGDGAGLRFISLALEPAPAGPVSGRGVSADRVADSWAGADDGAVPRALSCFPEPAPVGPVSGRSVPRPAACCLFLSMAAWRLMVILSLSSGVIESVVTDPPSGRTPHQAGVGAPRRG